MNTPRQYALLERMLLAQLGKRLGAKRREQSIAATALARQLDISRTTLYAAEAGDGAVSIGTYVRLIAALGLAEEFYAFAAKDEPLVEVGEIDDAERRRVEARFRQLVESTEPK